MPVTTFTVRLPDGSQRSCYSPSSVVKRYFHAGQMLPAAEFLELSREALDEASERVRAKFGFACSAAADSIREIEAWAGPLPPDAPLEVTDI